LIYFCRPEGVDIVRKNFALFLEKRRDSSFIIVVTEKQDARLGGRQQEGPAAQRGSGRVKA
jgi:hypothetical protein